MDDWSSPWAYVVDLMWRGVVIHAALWAVMITLNLRQWSFWSGSNR
jgi:hypothetical protein